MTNIRLKLSPPWVIYVKKLQALFDPDPEIAFNVDYNNGGGPKVTLATNNGDKATALVKILPHKKNFGNISFFIEVDGPFTNRAFKSKKELFDVAFSRNPVYSYSISPLENGDWFFDLLYVVFKNCVVQFFIDNLNDPHGITSTLYQEIASDIFGENEDLQNVFYATDIEQGRLGKPLGQWP